MENVKIVGIEEAHGKRVVNNDFYFEHFKKQNKDIKHFFEDVVGRKQRYELVKGEETALTIAIEAALKVLKNNNLTGKDIDMIIYSGTLPEYVSPVSSLYIHSAIEGKERCFCHDMNVNCLGMTYAFDMANTYIAFNPKINRVLIVGSDYMTNGVDPNNEGAYGQFGDVACALICEKTIEDCKLLNTFTGVNTNNIGCTKYPRCGFSNVFENLSKEEMYSDWNPASPWWMEGFEKDIKDALFQNNLEIDDVSMFCFTQIALRNIEKLRAILKIPKERSIFIADKYGYTGTSSPFLALYESIKQNKIKHGDYVVFATCATGGEYIVELIKY